MILPDWIVELALKQISRDRKMIAAWVKLGENWWRTLAGDLFVFLEYFSVYELVILGYGKIHIKTKNLIQIALTIATETEKREIMAFLLAGKGDNNE